MSLEKIAYGSGHYYKLEGVKVPNVTTILREGFPKPQLVPWAALESAKYAMENWLELQHKSMDEGVNLIKNARFRGLRASATRGSTVHALAEKITNNEEVDVPPDVSQWVGNYVAFLDEWKPKPVLTETTVASRRFNYAGTLDSVLTFPNGRTAVCDIKTSAKGIYPETILQLAAYRFADVYVDAEGAEQSVESLNVDQALAIWVREDGYSVYDMPAGEDAFAVFQACQRLSSWTANAADLIGPAA